MKLVNRKKYIRLDDQAAEGKTKGKRIWEEQVYKKIVKEQRSDEEIKTVRMKFKQL